MEAKLVLLLPPVETRKHSKGSIYTVVTAGSAGGTERNLYADFLRKAKEWDNERREPQLQELRGLLHQVHLQGPSEYVLQDGKGIRAEGEAFALPLARYEGWEDDLPEALRGEANKLLGLDALRLYCCPINTNLILFSGNVKRANQVYQDGSNVLQEFNEANRLTRRLQVLAKAGDLRNSGKTGRIDLDHLGWFDVEE